MNMNVIWQNLVSLLLLLMNIIIDVTYLISGIYTNFRRLYTVQKGHYATNHDVMKLMTTS